jgi:hypothetical protein
MLTTPNPFTLAPNEAQNLPTWRAAFSERTAELMAKLALPAYQTDDKRLALELSQGGFDPLNDRFRARSNGSFKGIFGALPTKIKYHLRW